MIYLHVRASDLIAAGFLIALAVLAIATTNWISSLEDQEVYHTLTSLGWRARQVWGTKMTQPALTSLLASVITLLLTLALTRDIKHRLVTCLICVVATAVAFLVSALQSRIRATDRGFSRMNNEH